MLAEIETQIPHIEKEKAQTPLSFNLSAEQQRAQDALASRDKTQIKLAHDGFVNNASYWAREYIGDIKTTHYFWEIQEENGKAALFHPQFGYADEIHKNALEEKNIPVFERERRKTEYQVLQNLSKDLVHAQDGDTFIWSSPPPEGIENETYGGYTMTHIYEIREVKGKKVLVGRDVKNNLDLFAQKNLLEHFAQMEIFNGTPSSLDILGTLVKTERGVSSHDVELTIKEQESYEDIENDEKKFDTILDLYKPQLESIFYQLGSSDVSEKEITEAFKAWAKEVYLGNEVLKLRKKNYHEGRGDGVSEDEYRYLRNSLDARFANRISGGSCGGNIGFTKGLYQDSFSYLPTYVAPSFGMHTNGKWEYHTGNCRVCFSSNIEVGPCSICKICEKKFN